MKLASHYRGIPKIVRIGSMLFAIEVTDWCDQNRLFGFCDNNNQKISLSPTMGAHQLANTFLHECMHGMHCEYGLTDKNNEESFTELGANGLCVFFQDNPEAVRWWMKLNSAGFV